MWFFKSECSIKLEKRKQNEILTDIENTYVKINSECSKIIIVFIESSLAGFGAYSEPKELHLIVKENDSSDD